MIRVLLAVNLFSIVEMGAWVSVLLYMFDRGGPTLAGLISVTQLLPAVLLAPVLGSLGDRLPRGVALSLGYFLEAVCLTLLSVTMFTQAPAAVVAIAATLASLVISFTRPVHYSALPMLSHSPTELVRANSVTGLAEGVGLFAGPTIAGLVVATSGFWQFPAMCVALMLVACGLTQRLGLGHPVAEDDDDAADGVLAGLRMIVHAPAIMALLSLAGLTYVLAGSTEILGIAFASHVLNGGADTSGVIVGADGIGFIIGSIIAAGVALRARLAPVMVVTMALAGIPLLLMAFARSLPVAVALLTVSALSVALSAVAGRTLLQRATAPSMLARVFAVQESMMALGLAVGAMVSPVLVAWRGADGSYVPLGLALAVVALLTWPALRALDRDAIYRPDVLTTMRLVPFLAAMPVPNLDRLSRDAHWVDCPPGSIITHQGDHDSTFYIVEEGQLSVTINSQRAQATLEAATLEAATLEPATLGPGDLGPGDSFDEIALLHDNPRPATITTLTTSRLLRIERTAFETALAIPHERALDGLLSDDELEARIVAALTREPQTINQIQRHLTVTRSALQPTLDSLTERGIITQVDGTYSPHFGTRHHTAQPALDGV